MILPLTHDSATSRRWPVVTIAILALCLFVQVALSATQGDRARELRVAVQRLEAFHAQHPATELPPLADGEGRLRAPTAVLRGIPAQREDIEDPERRADQEEVDRLTREALTIVADDPRFRFGYMPARGGSLTLVTYAFLHGGWLHLIFNAWFLWLCGCNIEDRWGRAAYTGFYLAAGVVAAIVHRLFAADPWTPVIGASGAVAGAMGAFLVLYASTNIHFVAFFGFRWKLYRFAAPAYVMLPLWLASEVFEAWLGIQDGVAHYAHVGGFVFGVGAALALRRTGLEKRVDEALEKSLTVHAQDPRLADAGAHLDAGRADQAFPILEQLAAERPADIDVQLELLRASKTAGDAAREIRAYERLIDLYLRADETQTAMDLYLEVKLLGREQELPPHARMFVGDRLARKDRPADAALVYASLHEKGIFDETAVRAALGHARAASRLGRLEEARGLLVLARESPFSTPELDALVDREMSRLGASTLPPPAA